MTNFIFKSANRLIKNVPINDVDLGNLITDYLRGVSIIQKQNRELRQDLVDVKRMINKLLIDKHLQMQVDEYFKDETREDSAAAELD